MGFYNAYNVSISLLELTSHVKKVDKTYTHA